MVAKHENMYRCASGLLSYHDAVRLAERVNHDRSGDMAVIDLAETDQTTTAALARLIVLRRQLRHSGGDLHLLNLHGQARHLYDINRLSGVLPCHKQATEEPERTR